MPKSMSLLPLADTCRIALDDRSGISGITIIIERTNGSHLFYNSRRRDRLPIQAALVLI